MWRRQRWALALVALLWTRAAAFDLNEPAEFELELEPETETETETEAEQQQQQPQPCQREAADQRKPLLEDSSWLRRLKLSAKSTISLAIDRLPDYFDFDSFAANFKRKYSKSQLILRRSVFFKRCLKIFKSRVGFRLGSIGYLQNVNKFSDLSQEEFRRIFMSGPPIELRPSWQTERQYYEQIGRSYEQRKLLAHESGELPAKASASDFELEPERFGEESRVFVHESQVRREIVAMLEAEPAHSALELAVREELLNSGQERFSQACAGQAKPKRPLPWPKCASRLSQDGRQFNASNQSYAPPDLNRLGLAEGIDWSQHPCFHQIYDQGDRCGKCYVMAATSLAEFYKCSEQVNVVDRRKFSKDYVLDCGQKYSAANMGCLGGSLLETIRFISEAGVFNIGGWKLRRQRELAKLRESGARVAGLDLKCPLNGLETGYSNWGDIKLELSPELVGPSEWAWALLEGPLVASVQMPAEGVDAYEGGVHEGTGCAQSANWHAMLLVGFGQNEQGVAYWRFRNSWGADWGEGGHFNLAMAVPGACLAGGVRVFREPGAAAPTSG